MIRIVVRWHFLEDGLKSGENELCATLREAQEEIGLLAEDVLVLGTLDSFLSAADYSVRPVVGVVPWPYQFKPEAREVSRVFTIPLDWLADANNCSVRKGNNGRDLYFYNKYENESLWGLSAAIMQALLNKISV